MAQKDDTTGGGKKPYPSYPSPALPIRYPRGATLPSNYPPEYLGPRAPTVGSSGLFLPVYPTTGGGGGGGGGGEAAPVPITWSSKYSVAGAPAWWQGMMPSQWTAETEFAAMVNALIPYLSVEDQRSIGSSLSRLFPAAFGSYSPEKTTYPTPPAKILPEQEFYFQSQQRATDLLTALDKMREASGKDESKFGPGYQYLRQLATAMRDYGAKPGQSQMSRASQVQFYSAIDPLLSETKGEQLGAYGEIARAITQPFFGAGKLVNVAKDESGNWVFGKANTGWF